jgi:hypothetical protein
MTNTSRTPRVSAAYVALLIEALRHGGRLALIPDEGDGATFRQHLLRANVLAQLQLLMAAPDARHAFDLTPTGAALAREMSGRIETRQAD